MTLDDVASACRPPTTPQTIGRLETGTRTVSIPWLNRIADALGVDANDLVAGGAEKSELPVIAVLGPGGATAPRRASAVMPPRPNGGQAAIAVATGSGDYRAGDEIWCDMVEAGEFGRAMNRDVLVPRPAGRFLFGRLIGRDEDKLHLLPLGAGGRQQVVTSPPWIAVATRLVRNL